MCYYATHLTAMFSIVSTQENHVLACRTPVKSSCLPIGLDYSSKLLISWIRKIQFTLKTNVFLWLGSNLGGWWHFCELFISVVVEMTWYYKYCKCSLYILVFNDLRQYQACMSVYWNVFNTVLEKKLYKEIDVVFFCKFCMVCFFRLVMLQLWL